MTPTNLKGNGKMIFDDFGGYSPRKNSINAESSLWVLFKDWVLRKDLKLKYYIQSTENDKLSDALTVVDWIRENINGRWHIRIYDEPILTRGIPTMSPTVIAKFNREEDAMAFKLRWV